LSLRAKDETPESAGCGIAIDMGASHLRFVLASVEGQILEESRERVHSEAGPRGVIAQIREGIARLIQSKNGLGTVRGIAIGVPGGVDPQTGKVVDANNVPGWREEDMGRELEETFQIPVFLDNDANMAAIGEHWRGVARGIANFVFIALGTGIGAGIFADGRICRGCNGFAGELFRMNLEWPRWTEDFPDTGYLETYVSGLGLAKLGRKVVANGNGDQPSTLADQRDARYIFEALHQGDPGAHALIEQSFVMLGVAVANVVTVLDPELIVFNGGLVKGAPDLLLETVGKVVRKMQPKAPKITLSTLGDKAQIWGALHTLLEPAQQCAIRSAQKCAVT
jgi:glucokinase